MVSKSATNDRVGHRLLPGDGQLVERGDQRLGHEPAAEVAEPAVVVGVERRDVGAHARDPGHRAHRALGVAVLDQRLADEHRAGALGDVPLHVDRARDPGLGDQHAVVRHQRREPAEGVGVDVEGLEVAGVDADQLGAEVDGAGGLGLVVHLDEHRHARARGPGRAAGAAGRRRGRRRSAGPGRRRPPGPRAPGTASTTKSLRSSGTSTAARTARRSSRLPPNRRSSVSTLIAAAPPAAYCRASAAGSAISARSPLLGLRRFTSAITLEPGPAAAASGRAAGRRRRARRAGPPRWSTVPASSEVDAHARDDVTQHIAGHGHAALPSWPASRRRCETADGIKSDIRVSARRSAVGSRTLCTS